MSGYEIECEECGWAGGVGELHCSDEDDASNKDVEDMKFNCCPACGEADCFEDIFEDINEDEKEII